MARNDETENDFEPRHRILGAIVLVSLGFIVFSIVLNEQPQQLSPEDKLGVTPDTRVVVTPVPSPRPQPDTRAVASIKPAPKVINNPLAPKPVPQQPAVESPAPTTAKITRAEPEKVQPSKPKTASRSHAGKWTVQVGTFADPANARRLRRKLEKQKYRVTLKVVALKQGRAVRVRVGPFDSRAGANRVRDTIRKKNGIDGVVVALN